MTQRAVAIHRFQATLFPVNAYLVGAPDLIVAIDATLGVGLAVGVH